MRVVGDSENPIHRGFTCAKGRQQVHRYRHPNRLLRSVRNTGTGVFDPIPSKQLIEEIASRLSAIVQKHGPRAVATYTGTAATAYPAGTAVQDAWMAGIRSPMSFSVRPIDQPGKYLAAAHLGTWEAGPQGFETADVWMLVGANPLVSMWGGPFATHDPLRRLQAARRRGLKLIVIDPRLTETAAHADLHLRVRPGEDAVLLAGILHVLIRESLYDATFVDREIAGFAELRAATRGFTPNEVAARTGLDPSQVVDAARLFGRATRGCVSSGTGPDMAAGGTLTEYLLATINLICGRVLRAGEQIPNPAVLGPATRPRAETSGPYCATGFGEQMRAHSVGESVAGMPTAALPDEILFDGEGAVRALIVNGGNPVASWPDQLRTLEALRHLELLVVLDVTLSATAKLADFVVATKMALEVPGITRHLEALRLYEGQCMGHSEPYAMYTPAVARPPHDADLIEEWEFFVGVAREMGVELRIPGHGAAIDLAAEWSADALFELLCAGGRVALTEVRHHPHGVVVPDPEAVVQAKDLRTSGRFDVGNPMLLQQLTMTGGGSAIEESSEEGWNGAHLMISRRSRDAVNSTGPAFGPAAGSYNPAFLHPDDCRALGVERGDVVRLASATATIEAIVEPADDILPGTVSISHAWGGTPDDDYRLRAIGSNTSRLVSRFDHPDPWCATPRMSAIPVRLVPGRTVQR